MKLWEKYFFDWKNEKYALIIQNIKNEKQNFHLMKRFIIKHYVSLEK